MQETIELLKAAVWNNPLPDVAINRWDDVFLELKNHAVVAIPWSMVKRFHIPDDLARKWKACYYQQIYRYQAIATAEIELHKKCFENGVEIVVIKGTAVAQYYPMPYIRTMGDIDFLVRPEQYEDACDIAVSIGWKEITSEWEQKRGRHRSFVKDGLTVEIHHFFSSLINTKENAMCLDRILLDSIESKKQYLRDPQNGLVLIEHIAQHIQDGLGLRQVIDWMMFVNKCLDDTMWKNDFKPLAEKVNIDVLAKTVTRMCQMYLGLQSDTITWCKDADESVCEEMMEYVMNSGNFGHSRSMYESGSITKIPSVKHPIKLISYLQKCGKQNWSILDGRPYLKPFAWIYQTWHYIKTLEKNKPHLHDIKNMYDEGAKRRALFFKLGLTIKEN